MKEPKHTTQPNMKRLIHDQIAKPAQTRGLRRMHLRANQLARIRNKQGDRVWHAAARHGCLERMLGDASPKQLRGAVGYRGVSALDQAILSGHLPHHEMSCFDLWAAGGRRGGMRRVRPTPYSPLPTSFPPATTPPERTDSIVSLPQ